MESATLTVEETAKFLRIGRNSAYEGVRTGEIPSVRIGKRILVPRAALERRLQVADPLVRAEAEAPEPSAEVKPKATALQAVTEPKDADHPTDSELDPSP